MDLTEPGSAFSGSLAVPVLRALSGRAKPATVTQIVRTLDKGSVAGVRRALERLASHGICASDDIGGLAVYSLNVNHILYPAVRQLLDAGETLRRRIRREIESWDPQPLSAVLFGSAAREDGDVRSDIDLLIIRETMTARDRDRVWDPQLQQLRDYVLELSGNFLQLVDWSKETLQRHINTNEPLIGEILRDGRRIYGQPFTRLVDELANSDGGRVNGKVR